MNFELSSEQRECQEEFKTFVNEEVIPNANQFDSDELISAEFIKKLAEKGYLGASVPKVYGGKGYDAITLGLLNEEFGRGYGSAQNLLTVYGMVMQGILKCGSNEQKKYWIPRIISGEAIGAFALTEPNFGSDTKGMETAARKVEGGYILSGRKKWITLAQIADMFLIFAQCEGKYCTFILEKNTPGLTINPINGMLGLRANMLAELVLEECFIPQQNLVGKVGSGLSTVAAFALDQGRYTTAWGCIGIAQACLEKSISYSRNRIQFDSPIMHHQLVRKMVSEMVVGVKTGRLLCLNAGCLRDMRDPDCISETLVAKYYASKMVNSIATNAVQIHGATGCSLESPVQRYFRDAKIMELIEGSTQMHEILIASNAFRNAI